MSSHHTRPEDPAKRAMLLTALYIAQEQYGYLSREAIERVAQRLGVHPMDVYTTASFYTLFYKEPVARYRIQVCEGLSCFLSQDGESFGAESLLIYLRQKLGLKKGESRTADGKFSLETVQCLAACDTAPNMRINDELYGNLTPAKVDSILAELAKE